MNIAVVTGGGNGIGEAICRRFANEGYTVAVVDIDLEAAERVAADIEGHAYRVDVGDEAAMSTLIDNIESHVGPIDVFVSNAGILFGDDPSGAASKGGLRPVDDRWQISWQVNVMAHVYAARALVPKMKSRGGGCLVNVCSAAGLLNQIGDATYATTKHAAVGFAEALAITHGDDGIQVLCVCPQAVATGLLEMADEMDGGETILGGADVDGILEPAEIADAIYEGMQNKQFMITPHASVRNYILNKATDYDRWIGGMRKFRRSLEKPRD